MSGPVLAGLDVGTTSVKALALRADGSIAARAEAAYALATPRAGWAEQEPEDWWAATEAVLGELRAQAGELAAIGLSGQMHGLVLLDERDRVLRPAILWNDGRTGPESAAIEDRIGLRALVDRTGNRAMAGYTAPKLLWVQRHEPDVFARVARVLLPKDYVGLRLTGEAVTDVSDASGTLLLDVERRAWSEPMLADLEIDPAWLPEVRESPAVRGRDPDGDVVVAAGAGDQAAGAVGVGVVGAGGPVSVVLGTSGVVFAGLDGYAADPGGRVHAFCHAVPGRWHGMGVMLSAAGSLRWLRDVVAADAPFEALVEEAARWEPGAEGLTFLPYLAGERTPHADPDARGAFAGLSLRHDRGALVRAVLEGVAFGLRDSLDLVASVGARPEVGRVSGGGARSDTWLAIVASVLDLPLQRMEVEEGAAFGAALLGGVAAGVFADVPAAVAACVRPRGDVVEPVPAWVEAYAEQRERFRALYPALRDAG